MTNQNNPNPDFITLSIEDYKIIISELTELRGRVEKLEKSMSPVKTPKTTESKDIKGRAWDVRTISATRDGKSITYAWDDNTYVYDKGVRMYVNAMIRECGGEWDKDAKKYLFSSVQKATACVKKLNGFSVESAKVDEFMQARKNK